MPQLKLDTIFKEFIKSENSEIIWNHCNQIENNKLKNELEKFIYNALTELDKDKFIFSILILQGYEFNFQKNEKHFEYITKAIISYLDFVKENNYEIKNDVSYIISEFFDIVNKLATKYDEIVVCTLMNCQKLFRS